jgi:hypothetical protein
MISAYNNHDEPPYGFKNLLCVSPAPFLRQPAPPTSSFPLHIPVQFGTPRQSSSRLPQTFLCSPFSFSALSFSLDSKVIGNSIEIHGFIVSDYEKEYVDEFYSTVPKQLGNGELKFKESVEKFDDTPEVRSLPIFLPSLGYCVLNGCWWFWVCVCAGAGVHPIAQREERRKGRHLRCRTLDLNHRSYGGMYLLVALMECFALHLASPYTRGLHR